METAATTRKRIPTIIVLILLLAVAVAGAVYALSGNTMIATFWSLVPPLIAIIMALVTKEVYSALLIGIILGNFFYGFADGVVNYAGKFVGFQLGGVNVAGDMTGLQLGVVNAAGRMHGVQIGALNLIVDSALPVMVIANASF